MSNYLSVAINILKILKIISARFQDGGGLVSGGFTPAFDVSLNDERPGLICLPVSLPVCLPVSLLVC